MRSVFIVLLFIYKFSYSQWTTLTAPAAGHLNDLDFLTADYGVVTGNAGILLLTVDGGLNWTDIASNLNAFDIFGVKVFNTDTIAVSTYDINTAEGFIYLTTDGGVFWNIIGSDAGINHKIDLEGFSSLWALGASLLKTEDRGITWDTLISNTAGTTALDVIEFANMQTGHVSGLVSGFSTYSAVFSRTEDGGNTWFPGDVFSFPNADAFTAMCFFDPDTAMYFMNQYAGFMPSSINKLIKLHGFTKVSAFPGDTVFIFSATNINLSMPAYINDAHFMSSLDGVALGDDGNVYATDDGGLTWNIDYSVSVPLKKIEVIDTIMYAVGNNGMVIRSGTANSLNETSSQPYKVYPNPAAGFLNIYMPSGMECQAQLFSADKRLMKSFMVNGQSSIDISALNSGIYFLRLRDKEGFVHSSKWVKE